jgi:CRP-like cAMP-binding protein
MDRNFASRRGTPSVAAQRQMSGDSLQCFVDAPMGGLPMPTASEFRKNSLLHAMPGEVLDRWRPHMEFIELPLGAVVYEAGVAQRHAYFPTSAIVSILYVMENGASTEIAVAGNEGVVGVSLVTGGGSTPSRAVVHSAGHAIRLGAEHISEAFDRGGPVLHALLRYTQALMTQMLQTAACNRHHTVDQQLCRWLLLSLDRLRGQDLQMTHLLIAKMLGVRREGVTDAATKLQRAGCIRYARGQITVLDRPGVEARSCECYDVVKREYDRLCPRSG